MSDLTPGCLAYVVHVHCRESEKWLGRIVTYKGMIKCSHLVNCGECRRQNEPYPHSQAYVIEWNGRLYKYWYGWLRKIEPLSDTDKAYERKLMQITDKALEP